MEIIIAAIGKTTTPYIKEGIGEYLHRLGHYATVKLMELADTRRGKSMPEAEQKLHEGKLILTQLQPSDYVVLLDERGREHTSEEFARWIEKRLGSGRKRLILVIGGPYGFSEEVYERADELLSLSRMTFTHEMVRLFAVEQLYRSFTILRGEPYHHS